SRIKVFNLKSALIIFVRNPVLGKVKSRLAATLGKEKALDIYTALLAHTHKISKYLSVDKFIFYEDFINKADLWENAIYTKFLQEGDDLGERMKNAFKKLFKKDYEKVIIIGSDCYDLTSDTMVKGYNILSKKDFVLGPASDGGYYLLGMNNFIPQIFDNKSWSSDNVYIDTINQINDLQYTVDSLALLNDIDVESDINFDKLKIV
ncbi:MAG: TIGR04282 family arsenosugar biosynthesis glycosyltransferase, partial [Ginsengibacter sp.]